VPYYYCVRRGAGAEGDGLAVPVWQGEAAGPADARRRLAAALRARHGAAWESRLAGCAIARSFRRAARLCGAELPTDYPHHTQSVRRPD
jgi:hypothetical protein